MILFYFKQKEYKRGVLAHLARAIGLHPIGGEFKTHRFHTKLKINIKLLNFIFHIYMDNLQETKYGSIHPV